MRLATQLRRFARDETGSVIVEGVLILPAMAWLYVGVYVFFDGYHAQSVNVKVAYTIGDVLSRETGVTPEYFDSLYALQGVLTEAEARDRRLRLTAVRWFAADRTYRRVWSHTRGGGVPLDDAAIAALAGERLPMVADLGVLLLTETWVKYAPAFEVGIEPFTFHDFVVTDPRFTSQICYNSVNDGGGEATETC